MGARKDGLYEVDESGSGGTPVIIADGSDVTEGSIADAAVISDSPGTISGKLRGLVKWAFENMPASLGQKGMFASFPVTIAIDQTISTKTGLEPPPTVGQFAVGLTSAQAVAANQFRRGLILTNVSTARISLGFNTAAILDFGITLYPGGTFVMDEYSFHFYNVNAIASAAASNLGIQSFSSF